MFSRSFKGVGLHYTAFRDAIREDSRQTTPSRGVTPRKKFAAQANVESRVNPHDDNAFAARARIIIGPSFKSVDSPFRPVVKVVALIAA